MSNSLKLRQFLLCSISCHLSQYVVCIVHYTYIDLIYISIKTVRVCLGHTSLNFYRGPRDSLFDIHKFVVKFQKLGRGPVYSFAGTDGRNCIQRTNLIKRSAPIEYTLKNYPYKQPECKGEGGREGRICHIQRCLNQAANY